MSINSKTLKVGEFKIEVFKKSIKNIHLSINPPNGNIKLSAPNQLDDEVIKFFIINKLGWIKKNIKKYRDQPRENKKSYISGESHFFKGKRYLLEVKEVNNDFGVKVVNNKLIMRVPINSNMLYREKMMINWYRIELKNLIEDLMPKCEKITDLKCNKFRVRIMKTLWGSCNILTKTITLNLELIKKPVYCLEYVIIHELTHLIERKHNSNFIYHMNKFMPKWETYRAELNNLPVK